MVDLFRVLPRFPAAGFSHILPSLDRSLVTTNDLLALEPLDVARRAQVPPAEVKKLADAILAELHLQLGFPPAPDARNDAPQTADEAAPPKAHASSTSPPASSSISTLDESLDDVLRGGIPTGYLVEVTGESGAGKTQFLLTLLLACQLPPPLGLSKAALYISTEAPLATTRLSQMLETHPRLTALDDAEKPSLSRILSIQTHDLESQDHIIRFQLPVAVKRHNVGLVVLDSVAANFRAELDTVSGKTGGGGAAMAKRSVQLTQLGALLRDLARTENVAIVVANQVADRFEPGTPQQFSNAPSRTVSYNSQAEVVHSQGNPGLSRSQSEPMQSTPIALNSLDPLVLDHQQRWFTGWGEERYPSSGVRSSLKTPSLGLVWTNQLAARLAMIKEPVYTRPAPSAIGSDDEDRDPEIARWRRWLKVVFAPWAAPVSGYGVELEITGTGIRALPAAEG